MVEVVEAVEVVEVVEVAWPRVRTDILVRGGKPRGITETRGQGEQRNVLRYH